MQIRNAKKTKSALNTLRRKHLVTAVVLGITFGILLAATTIDKAESCTIVGKECYKLEEASSSAAKTRGLSGRTALNENRGMLFVFGRETKPCMWMKDMRFPIDIIWLDEAGKAVDIEENVSPDTFPASFCPEHPAKYVVELNAGQVKDSGLTVTDRVMVN
jgi:uncharacterized membrane protein (UPF0127 family)